MNMDAEADSAIDTGISHCSAPIPDQYPTRMTSLLGIRWPLLLGGMMWLSDANLVAAMVRAGGMGFITARSSNSNAQFRQELQTCRRLTGGMSFGVNLTLSRRMQNNDIVLERLSIAIEEGVRIFETAGLPPTSLLPPRTASTTFMMGML